MINSSYGIAFNIPASCTMAHAKELLHKIFYELYGNYYNKHWIDNRLSLHLTTRNIFLENTDLAKMCFDEKTTTLEQLISKIFSTTVILAFYLDDSTGGRGFSFYDSTTSFKRLWINSESDEPQNAGAKIDEESFIAELTEMIEIDGNDRSITYHHKDYKHPMYGERGIIEKVIRGILMNRFSFDYEWQEFKGDIEFVDREDFPIQDLYLLFGNP